MSSIGTKQVEGTVEVLNVGSLAEKTMFLNLEFNRFGNSRQADVEVANTTAQQDRFSHAKRLLNSPELKHIQNADAALRMWIDTNPAVWKYGKSTRIVGFDAIDKIMDACQTYQKVTRPLLVKAFLDVYLERVSEAAKELGDKFNKNEYPSVEEVEKEFGFTYNLMSFSTPEKLKAFSPKLYAAEKEKLSQQFTLAVEDWKVGRRAILQEMVAHVLEILKPEEGKKKKLHAKTITKLQEFLNTFGLESMPDDAEAQAEVEKLKLAMSGVDADKIKESDNLKADLVSKLSEVSTAVSQLVTTTGRKFR